MTVYTKILTPSAAAYFQATLETVIDDEFLHDLRMDYPPEQWTACVRKLQLAAEWMDEAAISTIHSWCNRMLREHAFESGSLFTQVLETEQSDLLDEVVRDYWRTFIVPLPTELVAELMSWRFGTNANTFSIGDPVALKKAIRGLIKHAAFFTAQAVPTQVMARAQALKNARLAELKAPWGQWVGELEKELDHACDNETFDARQLRKQYYAPWLKALAAWQNDLAAIEPALTSTAWERLTPSGLAQACKNGQQPPAHPALNAMVTLKNDLGTLPSAREDVLRHAALWVSKRFDQEQRCRAQMGFDDLLKQFHVALYGDNRSGLVEQIRRSFPVALIDEFQDTDPVQYQIFDAIYAVANNDPATAIIMIGDPKQAIYSFRGADIHTYLQARAACVGRVYTLKRNFRSTRSMVDATNRCFDFAEARAEGQGAFLFKEDAVNPVPFIQVNANGRKERWQIEGEETPALTVWWLLKEDDKKALSMDSYRQNMSEACATEMVRLLNLGQQGDACFVSDGKSPRNLHPADMAVLVNTHREAAAIRAALSLRGVRSVYLSERGSVYECPEAREIMYWLGACAEPENARLLRAALATPSLNLGWNELERSRVDELAWEDRVLQFRAYRNIWQGQGVLPMLRHLLNDFEVPERLLARDWRGGDGASTGERVLTDLLHLAELLQQASVLLEGEHALIRHLAEQIRDAENDDEGGDTAHLVRLESDADLVKVVTVHKSKGLEYPLVFLPFASAFRAAKSTDLPLQYHDATGQLQIALQGGDDVVKLADHERLGEDLRKLYVALTRAQFATWVGAGAVTDAQSHALGYLLGGGEVMSDKQLLNELTELASGCAAVDIKDVPTPSFDSFQPIETTPTIGAARQAERSLRQNWWVASYSAISRHAAADSPDDAPESATEDQIREQGAVVVSALATPALTSPASQSIHAFPRGPDAGSFLHELLEWVAGVGFGTVLLQPELLREQLARRCALRDWRQWVEPLVDWTMAFLAAPIALPIPSSIAPRAIHLSELSSYQIEMEFWLSVHQAPTEAIDALVCQYTLDGVVRPKINKAELNGMLKGFIDLVFEHEGRYYVVDYKSNWLGPNADVYTSETMRAEILDARYDLQYVLYLFALHRLLKVRLLDYDYDRHIGGAVYLFLRGYRAEGHGIHAERPPRELFERLDDLFAYTSEKDVA